MTVILFMALATRIDLAVARDGQFFTLELLQRFTACVVETPRQFTGYPWIERRIRLDGQLAHQGVRMQRPCVRHIDRAYPKIHQARSKMAAVHPCRHCRIMGFRHQQRQAEIVQQAFGRALPLARIVAYLDQLANKGQLITIEIKRAAQQVTQFQHLAWNIRAALAQRCELRR